jgi:hypothetical protein
MRDYATWNVATWRIHAIVEWRGLNQNIIDALGTIEDDKKRTISTNAWQSAAEVNRASGLVIYIQSQLGLTDVEVDDIFTEAEQITLSDL